MKAEEVLRLTGITREILSLLVKKGVIRGKKNLMVSMNIMPMMYTCEGHKVTLALTLQ